MKKIFLVFIFLLNLLPILTNEHIMMGLQRIKAQSMGSENVTYYQCEKYNGDMYFSTTPCPASEYPEVCITACKYCQNSMSCDSYRFHHCHNMPSEESKSEWETTPPNTSSNNPSYGGGGCGSSTNNNDLKRDTLPQRNSDDYDFGHPRPPRRSITKDVFLDDLDKTISYPGSINQGSEGTCGAAVIEKLLAELFPIEFDRAAMSLYNYAYYDPWKLLLRSFSATEQDCKDMKKSTVDLIFQTAITQNNNYIYDNYDPIKNKSDNVTSTIYWRISDFLTNNIGLNVETLSYPSYEELHTALKDENTQFVIAFVKIDDNNNFESSITGNHYVQILNADVENRIKYWSWGRENFSSCSKVCKLYKIYKK